MRTRCGERCTSWHAATTCCAPPSRSATGTRCRSSRRRSTCRSRSSISARCPTRSGSGHGCAWCATTGASRSTCPGARLVLDLPADKPRPVVQSFRGATEGFELPRPLLDRLKALGRREQATLFMTLEAGFAALLHRYTGQDDLLVGTPISGRTRSETGRLIGCFLNTVVLRSRFTDGLTCRALVRQVRERALGAYAHPDLPFDRLVAA